MNDLTENGYFNNINTSQEAYNKLSKDNKEFYEINRYDVDLINNQGSFYADEKKCLDYYLGNSDGKAGIRLKKFIEGNI